MPPATIAQAPAVTTAQNLPTRNNNPGDLKDPKTGTFRTFASPEEGFLALSQDLNAKMSGATTTSLKPGSTLTDFANTYAPASDKNDPNNYAKGLAQTLKVTPDTKLSDLQPRLRDFTRAVAQMEGYKGVIPSLSTADFATKIRAKYSQYQGIDDATLTQKVLAKYPHYAAIIDPSATQQTVATSDSPAPAQGSDPSLLSKIVGGVGAFAKGLAEPVATMVARPFQAAAELAGASSQKVDAATSSLTGGLVAPVPQNGSDVTKDVGRGVQTAAFGLAPVAGGAAFGLGSGMENGSSPTAIAAQTVLGAAGGKALDMAAPYISRAASALTPKFVKNAFGALVKLPETIDANASKSAMADYVKNIGPESGPIPKPVTTLTDAKSAVIGAFQKIGAAKILPDSVSSTINKGAAAVNGAPSAALNFAKSQYGSATGGDMASLRASTAEQVSKALGTSGQKSAGVLANQPEKQLGGLEVLHDMAPTLKVKDQFGDPTPYDPTTATLPQHVQALGQAKSDIYFELEKNLSSATKDGVQVDTKPAQDYLQGILNNKGQALQHGRATSLLDSVKKISTPTEVNQFLQDLNAGLNGVFSGGQASIERKVDAGLTEQLNGSLDKAVVDTASDSMPIRALKNKYSALKSVEKGLVNKAQFMMRRVGGGLADYINPFNVADALDVLSHNPIGAAKAGLRAAMLMKAKMTRDPEKILNDVFSNIAQYKGTVAPRTVFGRPSPTRTAIVGGAIKGAFGGQAQEQE